MIRKIIASLDIPFYSGMYKGILSIILGVILIIDPEKSEPKLTFIMGMFWLTSGFVLLRSDPRGKMGKRLSKLVSVVAIVTGLLVVVRYFSNSVFNMHLVEDNVVNIVLGAVILLTGVFHLITEWKVGESSSHPIIHALLALFEIFLGLQLMVLPMVDHLYVRQTITVWAFLGGILFLSTAIYEHRQHRKAKKAATLNASGGSTESDGTAAVDQEDRQQSTVGEKTP